MGVPLALWGELARSMVALARMGLGEMCMENIGFHAGICPVINGANI